MHLVTLVLVTPRTLDVVMPRSNFSRYAPTARSKSQRATNLMRDFQWRETSWKIPIWWGHRRKDNLVDSFDITAAHIEHSEELNLHCTSLGAKQLEDSVPHSWISRIGLLVATTKALVGVGFLMPSRAPAIIWLSQAMVLVVEGRTDKAS